MNNLVFAQTNLLLGQKYIDFSSMNVMKKHVVSTILLFSYSVSQMCLIEYIEKKAKYTIFSAYSTYVCIYLCFIG